MTLIEFENVRFRYASGSAWALDGISLRIEAGEFVSVLGANGSGKSTLARLMNALLKPTEGTVRAFDLGTADADGSRIFDIRQRVGMVFQNPDDQIVASIVEDDVAFGPENLGIAPTEIRARVADALAAVGLAGFEKRDVTTLSGGQKQLLAIAGALAMRPDMLVLDEPTSMLDPHARDAVLRICEQLSASGTTIVLVTHFLDEARRSSRVIALDQGRIALDGPPRDVLSDTARLEELGLWAPFERHRAKVKAAKAGEDVDTDSARPLLQLHDVSFAYETSAGSGVDSDSGAGPDAVKPALDRVSLDIAEGTIVGVVGATGSGKSTLLQLAAGLLQPTSGKALLRGSDLADRATARQARTEMGIAFQYPERQLFAATVFDDVAFGPRNQGLPPDQVEHRVIEALQAVQLAPDDVRDRSPFSLSGGQQRRVALAGVLACQPRILMLDEPTAGLDPHTRRAFLQLIEQLNAEHDITVLLASHNHEDLKALCDYVVTLEAGRLAR